MFSGIVFSAMTIGESMSMLPAYGKAKAAAYKIFAMMDYEPDIDAYSAKGAKVCELLLHELINHLFPTKKMY